MEQLTIFIAGIQFCIRCECSWTNFFLNELLAAHRDDSPSSDVPNHTIILKFVPDLENAAPEEAKFQWQGQLADGTGITKSTINKDHLLLKIGNEVLARCKINEHTTFIRITESTSNHGKRRPQPGGYLPPILQFILSCYGRYIVHASAVSWSKRAMLLLGDSGRGKTTTALALSHNGLSFMGDDLIIVEASNGNAYAHALLFKPKVVATKGRKNVVDVIGRDKLQTCQHAELTALIMMTKTPGTAAPFDKRPKQEVLQWLLAQGNDLGFMLNSKEWFETASAISVFSNGWIWAPGPPETLDLETVKEVFV